VLLIVNGVCKETFDKNVWTGRKAAEVAMEERCIMADAVTHILHQVQLEFFLRAGGIQRRVDFTRYLVVACFEVLLHGLTQLSPALR
jgi:hypothetical protein